MLKPILFANLFLLGGLSYGRDIGGYPDPIPGLIQASQFCTGLTDDEAVTRCFQGASSADFISSSALAICEEQTWDNEKSQCIFVIGNKVITDSEVHHCQQRTFASQKLDCLKLIKRIYPYRTHWKVSVEPGQSEATDLCSEFFFDSEKDQCLTTTSSAQLFSEYAVESCRHFFSDSDKLKCLNVIKNKAVLQVEAEKCDTLFSDNSKLQCLGSIQRKWRIRN